MRFKLAAPVPEPSRPKGIGLTALFLCVFAIIAFTGAVFQSSGGTLVGLFNAQHLPALFSLTLLLALELFIIRSYWKGEDWARVLVLIASFLLAVDAVSTLFEHDGSLVVAMSHPVLFFRFALVVFLLYWLNTRPLREWFKQSPPTAADLIHQHLAGKLCTAIEKQTEGSGDAWHLAFEHGTELILHCPWRIAMDDNLAFATNSDVPVDPETPRQLLQNLRVKAVRVTPRTSDLFVTFEMGIELQTWSTDPQPQQWKFSDPTLTVIADSIGLNSHIIASDVSPPDGPTND